MPGDKATFGDWAEYFSTDFQQCFSKWKSANDLRRDRSP